MVRVRDQASDLVLRLYWVHPVINVEHLAIMLLSALDDFMHELDIIMRVLSDSEEFNDVHKFFSTLIGMTSSPVLTDSRENFGRIIGVLESRVHISPASYF